MNPDSKEFTEILARIPKWHMLTPGADVWKDGDEKYWDEMGWAEPQPGSMVGRTIYGTGRRPIPETVRRSEAWWALLESIIKSKGLMIARVYDYSYTQTGGFSFKYWQRLWEYEFPSEMLGGEAEIIKNLKEGPGAYTRWVLETD